MPFFVFEGLDGVGKSTLAARLAAILNSTRAKNAFVTSEPYASHNLITADDYIADRVLHINCLIIPTLAHKYVTDYLLCDRYVLSTAAYQSISLDDARRLLDVQSTFPVPDITFLLIAPIDVLEQRIIARGNPTGFDNTTRAFKERVQDTYLALSKIYPNVLVVDANRPLDTIIGEILPLILIHLPLNVS